MSIACVFSHERFYANRQETDRFPGVSFDFTDPKHWKSVDEVEIKKLQAVGATPASDFALTTARLDSAATEAVLEAELRALIKAHRDELGIATTWDEELCCLLQPALAAYEMEIIVGADIGSDDIHHAIRHQIPEGHQFKGSPLCFAHLAPQRMLATFMRTTSSAEIIDAQGADCRLALRARIFPYPEGVSSAWVMIAAHFAS
jgi:centrosomal protein CEP76